MSTESLVLYTVLKYSKVNTFTKYKNQKITCLQGCKKNLKCTQESNVKSQSQRKLHRFLCTFGVFVLWVFKSSSLTQDVSIPRPYQSWVYWILDLSCLPNCLWCHKSACRPLKIQIFTKHRENSHFEQWIWML